jgi:hypothetical protein
MSLSACFLAALSLAYAGMALLCQAMKRHQRQVWNREISTRTAGKSRCAGWLLIVLALFPCGGGWGWSVGIVAWCGSLSAAALLLVILLAYVPRTAALAALFAGAWALVAVLVAAF